jgi:long-chain acyl-CoA synthetase
VYTVDYIQSSEACNLSGLLNCRVARTPEKVAYRQYQIKTKSWRSFTWRQIGDEVNRWRNALGDSGLECGDRVALMYRNSVEWVVFEQAALSLGLVVVPIYFRDTAGNAAYILGDSESRLLLVGKSQQWLEIAKHRDLFPNLETVITLDTQPGADHGLRALHADDWLQDAKSKSAAKLETDDLATIVYTSGTTGRPKGVMLSHRNILSNAEAITDAVPAYHEDVFLSFLPLSHMLERTGGYYYPMMTGSEVVFARSVETLGQDLKQIHPTVLISVPRMFERAYMRIETLLKQKSRLKQYLFELTKQIGWERFEAQQGRGQKPALWRQIIWPLLRMLVVKKILNQLGGRLRVTISAGGRLDQHIAQCFLGFGLPLLQGYGLTEASPCVSGNLAEDNVPESVGPPLPCVELRIGENNELLVAGPGVMRGYWKLPEATAITIDEDGWLHTGDIAEIINGKIFIRGRIKDILVTSTGEKIPRADLELAISRNLLFDQVVVIGEGKPFLCALIVVQENAWLKFAEELGKDPRSPLSLNAKEIKAEALARVNAQLKDFPSYAQIRDVYLTLEPWTVENDLMTSTQKLRHTKITAHFEDIIERFYADHGLPH